MVRRPRHDGDAATRRQREGSDAAAARQSEDDVAPAGRQRQPNAALALRLCHAVGLATRIRVGRWVMIDTALSHLAPADRESEEAMLEAAVASGLVEVNPGPVPHSIKLTDAGLAVCQKAGS